MSDKRPSVEQRSLDPEPHEKVAAWSIATAAHRLRNPQAGDFTPGADGGHRALLRAAVAFIRDPYGHAR